MQQPKQQIMNQSNAVAIDYDYESGCTFWSDVTAQGSTLRKLCNNESDQTPINLVTLQNPDGCVCCIDSGDMYRFL